MEMGTSFRTLLTGCLSDGSEARGGRKTLSLNSCQLIMGHNWLQQSILKHFCSIFCSN